VDSGAGRLIVERVAPEVLTERQIVELLGPEAFTTPRAPGLGRPGGPLLLLWHQGRREVCRSR